MHKQYSVLTHIILQHVSDLIKRDLLIRTQLEQAMTDVQYISFDLEATQREKAALQRQIDNLRADNDSNL